MNDACRARVHAAAVAAWWTFLIGAAFVFVQWVGDLLIMSAQPALVLSVWGPGATRDGIRESWFLGLAVLKLSLWPVALAAVCVTLRGRQLRSTAGA
jgi:hypothetical protein